MDNLINRQDAIDAIERAKTARSPDGEIYVAKINAQMNIQVLPSAEPERKIELQGDESAIEILSELRSWFSCFDEKEGLAYHALSLAIRAIKTNYTARTERKTGKWIPNSPVTMKCDQCGLIIKDWDWHRFKYCPNCGSYNGGEQDE